MSGKLVTGIKSVPKYELRTCGRGACARESPHHAREGVLAQGMVQVYNNNNNNKE